MSSAIYTQEQLNIELLKQKNDGFGQSLSRIESRLDQLDSAIDSKILWLLGVMGAGFLGLLGVMAHGFKWIA